MQIAQWNYERNNTNFNPELELRMLQEEAQEFKDGLYMYFEVQKGVRLGYISDAIVEMVDAWADYQFVMGGSVFKYLGSDRLFNWDSIRVQEKYMYHILTDELKIEAFTLRLCLQAVVDANKAKGTEKVNGKIQKGPDWVDPKEVIKGLLKESLDV
jgi:hypothetical protein